MATQGRNDGQNETLPALHGNVHHLAQRLRMVQIHSPRAHGLLCHHRQRPTMIVHKARYLRFATLTLHLVIEMHCKI